MTTLLTSLLHGISTFFMGIGLLFNPSLGADLRVLTIPQGGTGTSTAPALGQLLVGRSNGTYEHRATSALGLVTGPAGSNTQIQFNNGGVFGASNLLTFSSGSANSFVVGGNATSIITGSSAGSSTLRNVFVPTGNLNFNAGSGGRLSFYPDNTFQLTSIEFGSEANDTLLLEGQAGSAILDISQVTPNTMSFRFPNASGTLALLQTNQTFTDSITFNGTTTPVGRLLVPMGELSYFSTSGTPIAIAAQSDGSSNMVLLNPVTTLTSGNYQFTDSNGRLTYTGTITKMFHVAVTMSITPVSANEKFVIGLFKSGSLVTQSRILQKVGNTVDTQAFAFHQMVELGTNDYIEAYAGNMVSANDITINTLNIFAMGM